jgi:ectoine hydroxylase-related dioxygenase (phytanoyl-CoA dioxygenase family)
MPGSHRQVADVVPRLAASGDAIRAGFSDIRLAAELGQAIPVTGKAGDVLFYSSYLVHGAVRFANKRRQRAVWTMSMGRADNLGWNRYSHLYHGADRDYAIPFWSSTTARVRSVFGWPPPGDAYYTPETLELLEAWYPEMDLQPYQDALLVGAGTAQASLSG